MKAAIGGRSIAGGQRSIEIVYVPAKEKIFCVFYFVFFKTIKNQVLRSFIIVIKIILE